MTPTEPKFKEALFNEIKGSLFEYLVARALAAGHGVEGAFLRELPPQYQAVLEQQDRMTREVYPDLLPLLPNWAAQVGEAFGVRFPGLVVRGVALTGQFSAHDPELRETDFRLTHDAGTIPVSLKLNKRQSAVNTKSGGAKSFLAEYFPSGAARLAQEGFNRLVDTETLRLHAELHEAAGIAPGEGWENWRREGMSELPGELPTDLRALLHGFYARLSAALRQGMLDVSVAEPEIFKQGLRQVLGQGLTGMVQLVCFHDIGGRRPEKADVRVHGEAELEGRLASVEWPEPNDKSSFPLRLGDWELHVRIKPMNKFTSGAPKINCAVKFPA